MSDRPPSTFLARESYRLRRLMDAARFLPFLAAFVFVLPMLLGPGAGTAISKVYVFFAWLVLIAVSFLISRRLAANVDLTTEDAEDS